MLPFLAFMVLFTLTAPAAEQASATSPDGLAKGSPTKDSHAVPLSNAGPRGSPMMLANLAAGALNDASGAGPANPAGYHPMLWMFFLLSLFGFVFAAALRIREGGPRGHGLETIRAGVTKD